MPIAILIVLAFLAITGYGIYTGALASVLGSTSSGDNVLLSGAPLPMVPSGIIASNPSTWPKGNRVWDCCRAIAVAEGYGVPNAVPTKLNNPGDLSDGASVYGSEYHSGSNVTTFPSAQVGWQWLYAKLQNIVNGTSTVYDASYSWREIGAKWAPPNAEVWAGNVASALGVDPDSSIADYVNG